jgi:glycosyltransferase involved in cell wall biosynthesis
MVDLQIDKDAILAESENDLKQLARIYINGRFLTQPITGVQRYGLELIHHFDEFLETNNFDPKIELICLVPHQGLPKSSWKNVEVRSVGNVAGNLWEQYELPRYLKGQLLFSPANIGPWHYPNQVVTLHDASVFAIPQAYSFAFRVKYKFIFNQLAKRAALLLTDSEFSRQELAHYLEIAPQRFLIVPLGSDHLDEVQSDQNILKKNILKTGSYLLLVASHSPHKNYHAAVQAVRTIDRTIKLVSVGGSYRRVFKKTNLMDASSHMLNLGYVSDQELKALYENALGFIAPSLYEGFGLPVLEAMRLGCPVISSHAASLPEVAGDAALYFDPHKISSITKAVEILLSSPDLRENLRQKGYRQAEKFTWAASAKAILGILHKAYKMIYLDGCHLIE